MAKLPAVVNPCPEIVAQTERGDEASVAIHMDTSEILTVGESFHGAPSVPPPSAVGDAIVVRSPREMRFLLVGLLGSILLFSMVYWETFGVINQKIVLALNVMLALWTVDFFQKTYVFKPGQIERRTLFLWGTIPLPESFQVRKESSGAIVVLDEDDQSVVVSISRNMGNPSMLNALKNMYCFSDNHYREIG